MPRAAREGRRAPPPRGGRVQSVQPPPPSRGGATTAPVGVPARGGARDHPNPAGPIPVVCQGIYSRRRAGAGVWIGGGDVRSAGGVRQMAVGGPAGPRRQPQKREKKRPSKRRHPTHRHPAKNDDAARVWGASAHGPQDVEPPSAVSRSGPMGVGHNGQARAIPVVAPHGRVDTAPEAGSFAVAPLTGARAPLAGRPCLSCSRCGGRGPPCAALPPYRLPGRPAVALPPGYGAPWGTQARTLCSWSNTISDPPWLLSTAVARARRLSTAPCWGRVPPSTTAGAPAERRGGRPAAGSRYRRQQGG